jgi:hypothetical protein
MPAKIIAARNKGFRDFSFVCRELAALTGASMAEVIDNEVAAILTDTAANTQVASVNKIISDHSKQEWARYTIPYAGSAKEREAYFAGKAAARRGIAGSDAQLYNLKSWRYPAWLMAEIRARRQASLERKLSRAGVAAKHWYEQARQLGLKVAVAARVKNADNKSPLSVWTRRGKDVDNYFLEGKNYSRLSNDHAGGSKALSRAVAKRVNLFQRAMRQWAQGKVKLVAKKYPGLLSVS